MTVAKEIVPTPDSVGSNFTKYTELIKSIMKHFNLLACLAIFSICLYGYADTQAKSEAANRFQETQPTYAQTQKAEFAALAKKPVYTTVKSRQEQARMEKDNSVIETMFDQFDNKSESRVFYNDSLLKMVVLRTSANGQKQALIYGQNGEVKSAPQKTLDKLLTAAASEIAKTVGINEGRKENEMLAKMLNASKPAEMVPAADSNPVTIKETVAVGETAQASLKVEVPEPKEFIPMKVNTEDSVLKLRAALRSLK